MLEDNGINTILENHTRQRIAQAKIKSDKLDACILSDLLKTGLADEPDVPVKEFREKGVWSDTGQGLSRTKTKLANEIHAI